jgi:hypothetical protein
MDNDEQAHAMVADGLPALPLKNPAVTFKVSNFSGSTPILLVTAIALMQQRGICLSYAICCIVPRVCSLPGGYSRIKQVQHVS